MVLNVFGNQLTSLPDSIGELSRLMVLNVFGNQLTSLPDSISELSQLALLNVSYNHLTGLPDGIGKLSQLTDLNIATLGLQEAPYWIQQLPKLESLNLSSNPLTTLPDWLGNMPKLRNLDISYLQLTAIPRSLLRLDIPFLVNYDAEIRLGIPFLANYDADPESQIRGIGIHGTKLSIQPARLFDQSRDKSAGCQESRKLIEDYFETPKIPVREAKVIFLGDGKVGKTYTIQRLLHDCRKGDYPTM